LYIWRAIRQKKIFSPAVGVCWRVDNSNFPGAWAEAIWKIIVMLRNDMDSVKAVLTSWVPIEFL